MVRLVLDKVYSCLRSWPRLRTCLVRYFFSTLLGLGINAPFSPAGLCPAKAVLRKNNGKEAARLAQSPFAE
jgi:hypothetical protein